MKRLLIIAFRPEGSEPRLNRFAEYLPEFGWETRYVGVPYVLPRGNGKMNHFFNVMGLEDFSFPVSPLILDEARRAVDEFSPHALLVSCPPFSGAILGAILKRRLGLPYVLDYRDPWIFNEARRHFSARHDRWYQGLERRVDRYADLVTLPGESYVDEYVPRMGRMAVPLINGFNPDMLSGVAPKEFDRFTFAYIGTMWMSGGTQFLHTYCSLAEKFEWFRDNSQFIVAGRIFPPKDSIIHAMNHITYRGLVSREEALALTAGADCLVYSSPYNVVGPMDLASRIYEYAYLGKYILAVAHPEGDIASVVDNTRCGELINFENQDEILRTQMLELVSRWIEGDPVVADKDKLGLKLYDSRLAISELANHLNKLVE